jgi:sirohydrochlorin cobaltochelatase
VSGETPAAAAGHSLRELPCRYGQILINRGADERFLLSHRDDAGRSDLILHTDPEVATEIARYDDAGTYRPLKTAPNLRHGWSLSLADAQEVEQALDFFYPGRLAAFRSWQAGALRTTPLRETLERQTGMYRVAARITEVQADELVGNFCRSDGGCLRTILWWRDAAGTVPSTSLPPEKFDPQHDQTGRGEAARPLLCQEACNLLVAAAREVVKSTPAL